MVVAPRTCGERRGGEGAWVNSVTSELYQPTRGMDAIKFIFTSNQFFVSALIDSLQTVDNCTVLPMAPSQGCPKLKRQTKKCNFRLEF